MARIATTLSDILDSVKQRMVDVGYNSSTIYFGLDPDELPIKQTAPLIAKICPGSQSATNPETNLFKGTLEIVLWIQNNLDQAQWSDFGLNDLDYGVYPQGDKALFEILNLHDLLNGNGSNVLLRPIRWLSTDEPKKEGLWIATKYTFEIAWENSASYVQETMLPVIDSRIDLILASLKARMVSEAVYTDHSCFIGLEQPKNKIPPNFGHYGVISPTPNEVYSSETMITRTTINVDSYTYLGLDTGGKSDVQLTSFFYGIYPKIDVINEALNWYMLVDDDASNSIIIQPLILRKIEKPVVEKRWARTRLVYDVVYVYETEITVIPPVGPIHAAYSPAFSYAWS